jgi:hypothetical protein
MSGRAMMMGGMGGRAYLYCESCLSDASITQYCYSPTIHIWEGGIRRVLGGRVRAKRTSITMDGEKRHGNLSGER